MYDLYSVNRSIELYMSSLVYLYTQNIHLVTLTSWLLLQAATTQCIKNAWISANLVLNLLILVQIQGKCSENQRNMFREEDCDGIDSLASVPFVPMKVPLSHFNARKNVHTLFLAFSAGCSITFGIICYEGKLSCVGDISTWSERKFNRFDSVYWVYHSRAGTSLPRPVSPILLSICKFPKVWLR